MVSVLDEDSRYVSITYHRSGAGNDTDGHNSIPSSTEEQTVVFSETESTESVDGGEGQQSGDAGEGKRTDSLLSFEEQTVTFSEVVYSNADVESFESVDGGEGSGDREQLSSDAGEETEIQVSQIMPVSKHSLCLNQPLL